MRDKKRRAARFRPNPLIINNQKLIKMQTKEFKIKDDNNVMIESFQSITEFREIIKSRKEGSLWEGHARYDDDSDSMRVFSQTTCFGEADKLLADGYTEGVEMLKREIAKLPVKQATKKRIVYRPQGSSPSVGRYISGNPNCMRKSINKPRKTNVVKIYFSSSYGAKVSAEKATQYGAELLNLIHSTENSGYRVELTCVILNDNSEGKVACATMPIKKPMETLNLAKVVTEKTNEIANGYDQATIDKAYKDDTATYDFVTFRAYTFNTTTLTKQDNETDDALKARQTKADAEVKKNANDFYNVFQLLLKPYS